MTKYERIRDEAMMDLVRDPRQVVYAADARIAELEWMLDECIRHGQQYRKRRGGYADFFELVKADLAEAYREREGAS